MNRLRKGGGENGSDIKVSGPVFYLITRFLTPSSGPLQREVKLLRNDSVGRDHSIFGGYKAYLMP